VRCSELSLENFYATLFTVIAAVMFLFNQNIELENIAAYVT